jgi:hypothetical protein
MNWAYRWFRDKRKLSIEEVAEYMINILFSGILKNGVVYDAGTSISV